MCFGDVCPQTKRSFCAAYGAGKASRAGIVFSGRRNPRLSPILEKAWLAKN
jgi:hypothetical protein